MEDLKGCFVCSLAGRDRGGLYWVFDQIDDVLFLADGKTHKLAKPKRKRKKHAMLLELADEAELRARMNSMPLSDSGLRKMLAVLRDRQEDASNGQGGNHAWQKTI